MEQKNIAILYICTGQYYNLFQSFYDSAKKYFLTNHKKTFFVWSDTKPPEYDDIIYMPKRWRPWPHAAVYRYHYFNEAKDKLKDYDYCYFFNANMLCQRPIDEEVFPDTEPFVAAEQPYQFRVGPGEARRNSLLKNYWTNRPDSPAFIPFSYWDEHPDHSWLMGGFNGGRVKDWLEMVEQIMEWVNYNVSHGIYLKWHDEPYMNKYMIDHGVKRLNPTLYLNWYKSQWYWPHVKLIVRQKKEILSTNFRVQKVNPTSLLDRLKLQKS